MAEANTSQVQVRYVAEASWAVDPVAQMRDMRVTGHTLRHNKQVIESQELRADAMVPDHVKVYAEAGGGIPFELSYDQGSFDMLMGLCMCAWLDIDTTAIQINASTVDDSFTATSGTPFATAVAGMWVKASGFTNAPNNGFFKIVTVSSNVKIIVDANLTTETGGGDERIRGSMIRNANKPGAATFPLVEKSFLFEAEYSDITQFVSFHGMEVNTMQLNFAAAAMAVGSIDFLGKKGVRSGTTLSASAPLAAGTADVMNCTDNVGTIQEAGASLATALFNIQMSATRGLRGRKAIGSEFPISIGRSRFRPTGRVTAYWKDGTLWDKFIAHTTTSLHWRTTDAAGNTYFWTLPAVKFNTSSVDAPGPDQDVFEEIGWAAKRDPTTGCMLQVDKFAA